MTYICNGLVETKYENLKAEAKIISNENKSLVTELRLLNNEFSASHERSNLHPTPSKGVEAIKRPDNSDTFEPSAHNNKEVWQVRFISDLQANCLQVVVMDLKKTAA